MQVWFEYVRSAANIADLPSREWLGYGVFDEHELAVELGSTRIPMVVPDLSGWRQPFKEWVAEAHAHATRAPQRGGKKGRGSRAGARRSAAERGKRAASGAAGSS